MNTELYWPLQTLILWTLLIGFFAAYRRVREARSKRISLRLMSRAKDVAGVFEDTQVADNFNNLFQVPVLFYVWCLTAICLQLQLSGLLVGAWLYVACRILHSLIQITHNHVLQRFRAWLLSNILLLILWCATSLQLIASLQG